MGPLVFCGCKDKGALVRYDGEINLRKNHLKPIEMNLLEVTGPVIQKSHCNPAVGGSTICYVMRHVPKDVTRAYADFARNVLQKYKNVYEFDGRVAGYVSRTMGDDVRIVEQNELKVIREGPDICVQIHDELSAFVRKDKWMSIQAQDAKSSDTHRIPIRWMPFDDKIYLYNIIDFTNPDMMDKVFQDHYSHWFNGKPDEWTIKASRSFAVTVCLSRLSAARIELGGVIFKLALN
jgi:hypothetical protein